MPGELRRTLRSGDLTLLVLGNVIGSGIFLVPSVVLSQSGTVGVAMAVWVVGGVLSLFGALTYGELGSMDRSPGGLYAYIRDAWGPLAAFLYGWTLFFVIGTGTVATLAVATANYMTQFVPLSGLGRKALSVGLIGAMAALNVAGTRRSASIQNVATGIKVAAIVVMGILLIAAGGGGVGSGPVWPARLDASLLSAAGTAMIAVLWAYEGWQYVTFAAGETVEPQRTLPRSIALGTACLIGLYLLANVAYLSALGPERVAASERVAGEATAAVLGPTAAGIIALAIMISMFSAAHSTVLTAPRAFFAMAEDGVFFRRLAEVHPRFGTPAFAILTSCAWSAVLAMTGTFEQLLTYVVFAGWIFYGLGGASVFVLRRTRASVERPFRVPGYPVTPALFVLSAAAIVGNALFTQPVQGLIGLGVVSLGAPAFFLWRRRSARWS